MTPKEKAKFREAHRKEKDPAVKLRMTAINLIHIEEKDSKIVAKYLGQTRDWVYFWTRRFREGGIDALRNRPHTGRPPKVSPEIITKIIDAAEDGILTPKKFRLDIHDETGVWYHHTHVRRLMREQNMSPKTPELVHRNKADEQTIRRWQCNAKRQISRLKKEGFAIVIQDESIFVNDPVVGRKYWSAVGVPITIPYNGSHRRIVAYGAIATDGRRFFRTYDKFNGPTFLRYLKELRNNFGKVLVIMDGASAHKTRDVKKFVADNPNTVRVRYLPVATPEISLIEEFWHQAKRDVLVSEYYATIEEMRHALSEYLRTAGFDHSVMEYLGNKPKI